MTPIIFAFPEDKKLMASIASKVGCEIGDILVRDYPEEETLVKFNSDVKGKNIIVVCNLKKPNSKIMGLIYFAETAREFGAKHVQLIAPYLAYMRQDKRFNDGEAITSNIFAKLLSNYFDSIITIDPHLHRHKSMDEIYTIPSQVLHAAAPIAEWVKANIEKPLLVGPDEESGQWVSDVALKNNIPYIVLKKERLGDRSVKVSVPDVEKYKDHTPVLIDDIISTAHTMMETVKHLNNAGMKKTVCIGVHAVFTGNAYEDLQNSGVEKIVSCNTISHISNAIDISGILADALKRFKFK